MTLGSKKERSLLTAAFGKPAAERGGEKEGGAGGRTDTQTHEQSILPQQDIHFYYATRRPKKVLQLARHVCTGESVLVSTLYAAM